MNEKMRPSLELTNRLFGRDPDPLRGPYCALSPTITCSTTVVAHVLRRVPDADPSRVAIELVRAWSLYQADRKGGFQEVLGIPVNLITLDEKGSIWSHPPVHASAYPTAQQAPERAAEPKDPSPQPARPAMDSEGQAPRSSDTMKQRETRPVHLKFPNAFVYPSASAQSRGPQRAICRIPPGVRVHGVDVGGYAVSLPMRDAQMDSKTLGRPIVFAVRENRVLRLFKGSGNDRHELKVRPWDLTTALAKSGREFRERRRAERDDKENPNLSNSEEPEDPPRRSAPGASAPER